MSCIGLVPAVRLSSENSILGDLRDGICVHRNLF